MSEPSPNTHAPGAPMPTDARKPEPTDPARILVVDDQRDLADTIAENLAASGHEIEIRGDGPSALEAARTGDFDLLVLDVMLPGMDGYAICRALRDEGNSVPILFLTAHRSTDDRVRGLEAGGDDYLSKPVHLREFLLRVDAMLRRRLWNGDGGSDARDFIVRFGDNEADLDSFRARAWDGVEHLLTRREARLLGLLSASPRQAVSREVIVDALWGHEARPSSRAVDRYVDSLRHRFEIDPRAPRHFLTVEGIGFRFEPSLEQPEMEQPEVEA